MSDIISNQAQLDDQLADAVKSKDYTAINLALQNGANINRTNTRGSTLLLQSVQAGNEQLASFLLKNGADATLADNQGMGPMTVASRRGMLSTVQDLVKHGGDVNEKDSLGSSALMEAILGDQTPVALFLIEKKAKVDQLSRMGSQALLLAAERKNLEVVTALLAAGANPDCRDSYGLTPLIAASWGSFNTKTEAGKAQAAQAEAIAKAVGKSSGDAPDTPAMQVAQALIAAGADVNAKGRSGLTALANASTTGVWALCHLLIDKGANVNVNSVEGPQGGYSPLMMALVAKKPDLTSKILARKGEINYKNSAGLRAVDLAVSQLGVVLLNASSKPEQKEAARANFLAIIGAGGSLDARSQPEGLGLIHVAALSGDMELLQMALSDEKAARVVAANGETALHLAVQFRSEKAIVALLASDAVDVNARDKQGHTALHTLSFNPLPGKLQSILKMTTDKLRRTALINKIHDSSRSIATKLLARGADVNSADNEGWTPLLEAVRQNSLGELGPNEAYIDFLVENGADLSLRNKNSDHVGMLAAKLGKQELLEKFFAKMREQGHETLIKNFIVESAYTAPEHYSLMEGFGKTLKWAMDQGSDIEALDEDGQKALVVAAATNQEELVELLLQLGADVNGRNEEGETAVMHAMSANAQSVLRILMEAGADIDLKRNDGGDAWTIGYRDNRHKCIDMLREQRDRVSAGEFEPQAPKRYAF